MTDSGVLVLCRSENPLPARPSQNHRTQAWREAVSMVVVFDSGSWTVYALVPAPVGALLAEVGCGHPRVLSCPP